MMNGMKCLFASVVMCVTVQPSVASTKEGLGDLKTGVENVTTQNDIDIKAICGFAFGKKMQIAQKYKFEESVTLDEPFIVFRTAHLTYNSERELHKIKFEIPKADRAEVNRAFAACQKFFEQTYGCKFIMSGVSFPDEFADFSNSHVSVALDRSVDATSLVCEIESIRYRKKISPERRFASLKEDVRSEYVRVCPMLGRTPEEQIEYESDFKLTEFCGFKFGSREYRKVLPSVTGKAIHEMRYPRKFSGNSLKLTTPFCGITDAHPTYTESGELCELRLCKPCANAQESKEFATNVVEMLIKKYMVVLSQFKGARFGEFWAFHSYKIDGTTHQSISGINVFSNSRTHEVAITLSAGWVNTLCDELLNLKYANVRIQEFAGFVFGSTNCPSATMHELRDGYIGKLTTPLDGLTSAIVDRGKNGGILRLYLFSDRIADIDDCTSFQNTLAKKLSEKYGFEFAQRGSALDRRYEFSCENFHAVISKKMGRVCLEICDHHAVICDDGPGVHHSWLH